MTKEQILAAAHKYELELERQEFTPQRADPERTKYRRGTDEEIRHVLWMCKEIPLILLKGKLDKAVRWLCFCQGVLWNRGVYTIKELKDDNRNPDKEQDGNNT